MDLNGCEHCLPDDPATAWEAHRGHVTLARPIDESHYGVTLLACSHCGQRFVKVFSETIDWIDGEDPQHWELMAISPEEAEGLMRSASVSDLRALPARRSVVVDHPEGARIDMRWGLGIEVREHD